jgi:hypothetical protein
MSEREAITSAYAHRMRLRLAQAGRALLASQQRFTLLQRTAASPAPPVSAAIADAPEVRTPLALPAPPAAATAATGSAVAHLSAAAWMAAQTVSMDAPPSPTASSASALTARSAAHLLIASSASSAGAPIARSVSDTALPSKAVSASPSVQSFASAAAAPYSSESLVQMERQWQARIDALQREAAEARKAQHAAQEKLEALEALQAGRVMEDRARHLAPGQSQRRETETKRADDALAVHHGGVAFVRQGYGQAKTTVSSEALFSESTESLQSVLKDLERLNAQLRQQHGAAPFRGLAPPRSSLSRQRDSLSRIPPTRLESASPSATAGRPLGWHVAAGARPAPPPERDTNGRRLNVREKPQ